MRINTSVHATWRDGVIAAVGATIDFDLRMSAMLELGSTLYSQGEYRPRLDNEISVREITTNAVAFSAAARAVQSALGSALELLKLGQTSPVLDDDWSASVKSAIQEVALLSRDERFILTTTTAATLHWVSPRSLDEEGAEMARLVAKAIKTVLSLAGEVSFDDETGLNLA